jgi:hypothetical protein
METKIPDGFMIRSIPVDKIDLKQEIERLLVTKGFVSEPVPLETIHEHLGDNNTAYSDDQNGLTRAFYETDDRFNDVYLDVLKYIHTDILKYDFVFQTTPTIRFNTPGRSSEIYRSKDDAFLGYHVDSFNGHPLEEINIWMPLTRCYGTNTLKMASLEHGIEALHRLLDDINYSADIYYKSGWDLNFMKTNSDPSYRKLLEDNCHPIVTDHGELVFFDPRCIHSTTDNHEDTTRVSLDFRVIRVEDYENISTVRASQGRSGRKFTKGDIFFEKTIAEVM